MELSLDRYYRLNRLFLSMIGLWPYQSATNAWIRGTLVVSLLIWIAFCQMAKIFVTELTADFIFDCMPVLIFNIGIIMQFLSRVIINHKLRDLFDQIKTDWERTRSEDEIKIMQTYATEVRIVTKLFSFYVIGGTSAYIFITFIPQILDIFLPLNESRSREHPFHIESFIDEKYFYVIRFQMYFVLMLMMIIALANGTMFAIYTHHVSGIFATLGHRAEELFTDDEYSSKARSIGEIKKDYTNIALFVEDHRNVMQFVDIVQSCYSFILSIEFLGAIILMGLTLLQIIKFSGLSDRPIRSVVFVGGQLFYVFIYSYMGQNIIDTSTQLFTKICYGMWHNMSIWKRKMMLFIMMKCSRTISVRMCYVQVLSLENFSGTVQLAISISMLLLRIQDTDAI